MRVCARRLLAGAVGQYDKANDRVTTAATKPLRAAPRVFHNVTTSDDPKLREVRLCLPHRTDQASGWRYSRC
jgi:hypothetical protein